MAGLLIEARDAAAAARLAGQAALDPAILDDLLTRYRALAAAGLAANIFTSSQAERTIRPVKVAQRGAGSGWRTLQGLADFAIVESYLSTAAKCGITKLDARRDLPLPRLETARPPVPPDSSASGRSRPCRQGVAARAVRSIRWHQFGNSGRGQPTRTGRARSMREDARQRVTEFVKDLYAAGEIDADRLDTGIAGVLAARSEAELAEVVRSLPAPVALTSQERRLARPLEIHSGLGRLQLAGKWQVASQTHISADIGSIRLDLTEAEFDDHVIDLHIYTGWGSITIIVPQGMGVQVIRHRGGVDSRLDPPVPGLPLVRLDVTTNIGRVHLRHPGTQDQTRRRPGGRRRR